MSQIPTSAPRTPSLLDGLSKEALPSESKSAKPDKAKGSFADHLTAPDAQATLTQAKRLTQGASRSSPSLTKEPSTQNKALPKETKAESAVSSREAKAATPDKAPRDLRNQKSGNLTARSENEGRQNQQNATHPKSALSGTSPRENSSSQASTRDAEGPSQTPGRTPKNPDALTASSPQANGQSQAQDSITSEKSADSIPQATGPLEAELSPDEAKASLGDDWEARLNELLLFMGIPPMAIQKELPSLAILTGQMQAIDAEAIPKTLAQSPLIGEFMSAESPNAVMSEIKPLGEWLTQMGIPLDPASTEENPELKALLEKPVALKELLQGLNIDSDRVAKEATILQEALPIDGAAPYMLRAERQKAEAGPLSSQKPSLREGASQKETSAKSPTELAALMSQAFLAANSSEGEWLPSEISSSGQEKLVSNKEPISLTTLPTSFLPNANELGLEPLPLVAVTEENPFQSMNLDDSESFEFSPKTNQESVLSPKAAKSNWMESMQAIQLQTDAQNIPSSLSPKTTFAGAQESALDLSAIAFVDRSTSSDEEQKGNFGDDNRESDHQPSQVNQKSNNSFELGTKETQKAQPTNPVQKAVFEKAEMLVKEGGGAIRIDIGNTETGPIDLAVEVKDNTVEVKISASSPEARQLIAQELPRLKESLQNQNLNLSKVEVGVTGGSSYTSSDGRSSRREQSQQSESTLQGIDGTRQSRRSSRTYTRSTQSSEPLTNLNLDGSGIKVRV